MRNVVESLSESARAERHQAFRRRTEVLPGHRRRSERRSEGRSDFDIWAGLPRRIKKAPIGVSLPELAVKTVEL